MVEAVPHGEDWIGIDLGTSNSCVGLWVDEGRPGDIKATDKVEILPNPDGANSRTTPSVVLYKNDGSVVVGAKALNQMTGQPKNALYNIKRIIGKAYSEVQGARDLVPYDIVEGPKG